MFSSSSTAPGKKFPQHSAGFFFRFSKYSLIFGGGGFGGGANLQINATKNVRWAVQDERNVSTGFFLPYPKHPITYLQCENITNSAYSHHTSNFFLRFLRIYVQLYYAYCPYMLNSICIFGEGS